MPDFGSPVAQNVNVNPLRTMADILGLKDAQLGLQERQARVQQEQQTARQRSNLGAFYQNFDPTKHMGPDGTYDLDNILTDPKLRAAAGDSFPDVVQHMIAAKQGQLMAKQQLANLNDSLRDQFSSTIGGLRTDNDVINDTDAGRAKVKQAISNFAESGGTDASRVAQIYGGVVDRLPKGKLASTLSNFQLQAMRAGEQASHQVPNYATVNTGATTEVRQINPQAANPQTMPQRFTNTVPPGAVVVPDARGAPFIVNPQHPDAPQPVGTGPGAPPAQKPSGFQAPAYPGYQHDIQAYQGEVQSIRDAAGQAPLNRNIYQTILRLGDDTTTGQFTAWAQRNPVIGQIFGDNYQELNKYLEKNAIANMTAMGGPPSDARLSAATAANGSGAFNPKALKNVTQFNYATNTGVEKFRQGIDAAVGTQNPDYTKLPTFKAAWAKNFDIDVFRLENAVADGDNQAQRAILDKLTPAAKTSLARKMRALDSLATTGKLP